jgi:hypothetical protein
MNLFKRILFSLMPAAGFYIVGVFIMWDFNPANWDIIVRMMVGLPAVVFGGVIFAALFDPPPK